MPAHAIHVHCSDRGTWMVQRDDEDAPTSTHASETEAERAARERAEAEGREHVVVHDRYRRTRIVPAAGRRGWTRA